MKQIITFGKYSFSLSLCVGNPIQYGDCESCHKKVTHQTYSLSIFKIIQNQITGLDGKIQVSSTYGHEECLNSIVEKYRAKNI